MFARRISTHAPLVGLMLTLLAGVSRAEEEKEGMPQLDPHSFASQLFWLTIFFVLVFVFLRFIGLPRVTAIIDERAKKIGTDIASAELLRTQAAEAEKTYETTMAAAQGKARQLLAETHEQNAAILAEETKLATAAADHEVNQAVKRIEADRSKALHSIRDVARGLAADITAKLAGRMPSADRVALAVDLAAGEIA
ncbi:MAG: H+transporting two-sector ATPase subunit [Rhodospirillales bacterium]|nr:H+transporting two-sector ATPase subunit [Rhodospirillales bacterium]